MLREKDTGNKFVRKMGNKWVIIHGLRKKTIVICMAHNEERGLREYITHRTY